MATVTYPVIFSPIQFSGGFFEPVTVLDKRAQELGMLDKLGKSCEAN
jgi:hypothetical protein